MKRTKTLTLAAVLFAFTTSVTAPHASAAVNAYLYIDGVQTPPSPPPPPRSATIVNAVLLFFGLC